MVKLTTSEQSLSSKTVTEYAPALSPLKLPEATGPAPISNVKGGVPPDAEMVADPVVAPLQSASTLASKLPSTGLGSLMLNGTTSEQPLSSRTVTE